jgi:hypothetical protein
MAYPSRVCSPVARWSAACSTAMSRAVRAWCLVRYSAAALPRSAWHQCLPSISMPFRRRARRLKYNVQCGRCSPEWLPEGVHMSVSQDLSVLIAQAEFRALPPDVVEVAKTVILDGLAVTLAGSVEPPARDRRRVCPRHGGDAPMLGMGPSLQDLAGHGGLR